MINKLNRVSDFKNLNLMKGAFIAIGFFLCFASISCSSNQRIDESKVFVNNFIDSMLAETEFYKSHVQDNIYEGIQSYRAKFTKNYEIVFLDYSWHIYEFGVKFENNNDFSVDLVYKDGDFKVVGFSLTSTAE